MTPGLSHGPEPGKKRPEDHSAASLTQKEMGTAHGSDGQQSEGIATGCPGKGWKLHPWKGLSMDVAPGDRVVLGQGLDSVVSDLSHPE